jgi:hypothetical protein
MLDIIAKIIPPPLLLGLLLYGLVCFVWLQPVTEERMAVAYVAQCEAGTLPDIKVPRQEPQSQREGDVSLPAVELPLSLQIISELKNIFRDDAASVALPYESGGSACSCAVAHAFDRVFWPSLFYVASLKTYLPRPIQHFDQYVGRELGSGTCGNNSGQ